MKIGFIGAGKVGFSLGKYFSVHGKELSGYYSRNAAAAKEAALFTNSDFYSSTKELISHSDIIFITVTDGAISEVWNSIKGYPLTGKIFCHCSGSLSSSIFSDIESMGAAGYSVHPLYAIHSREHSYKDLSNSIFTIEGSPSQLSLMQEFMKSFGNTVQVIPTETKTKYHAAAVFASNHMNAIIRVSMDLLQQCGFSEDNARTAITPLMTGNMKHLTEVGPVQCLTGPVERNDVTTVENHIRCLPLQYETLYKELTKVLLEMGKEKHPELDYSQLSTLVTSGHEHS